MGVMEWGVNSPPKPPLGGIASRKCPWKNCSSIKAAAKMKKEDPIPRVREDLEVIPTSYQGQKALLVRDFLGLIRDPLILQGDALQIIGLIDGKRTVRDIELELVRLKSCCLVEA